MPPNGAANWSAGFLPASHQATTIRVGAPAPIYDLHPPGSAKFITKESERDGLALLEQLNREHIAAPAIEQLARLHGELADRIRRALAEWDGEVLLAGLFGSAARRDGDERSDIDLLVVSDSPGLDELVARAKAGASLIELSYALNAGLTTPVSEPLLRHRDAVRRKR